MAGPCQDFSVLTIVSASYASLGVWLGDPFHDKESEQFVARSLHFFLHFFLNFFLHFFLHFPLFLSETAREGPELDMI